MIDLHPNQIDIWLAFPDDIGDEELLAQYRQLMTEKERDQERRFYFKKDQHRYLVTRTLVRTVLSRYAPIKPEQWRFSTDAYGKPAIENDDAIGQKISFNISHTQGLIVLGIANEKSLGVDTENIRVRQAPINVARHYFSVEETDALHALPENVQHDHFFQYWTLKEAYIKARGMGLSIPLDQFSFRFYDEAGVSIKFHPLFDDHPSCWRFWQFRVFPDYLMAVCVEREKIAVQQLNIRKIIPLEVDEQFVCSLLRKSM
jgi:4'-phosphopantetheinyl transferase